MFTFPPPSIGRCSSVLALIVIAGCGTGGRGSIEPPGGDHGTANTSIHILSNRPELISGGDALIAIDIPQGADTNAVTVQAANRDVTHAFALRPNGRFMGLVEGLPLGESTVKATLPDGSQPQVTITNHPIGGPVFSGPQIQPWPCLDGAEDLQCNRPVQYEYQYMPTGGTSLQPYDPENPPANVATTTTDQGKTVPFIVRIEHGTQNRGQYAIAVLFDPTKEWLPWAPQEAWNGKTVNHGGSGCGTHHGEGPVTAEYLERGLEALSRGFLSWETQLSHNTQNCNLVVQAESLMMAKEHIVETYGPIRYTIGEGGSGGSIKQQQAANAYPGIYDGIIPSQSFTDTWSTGAGEVLDCRYLVDYFLNPLQWELGVVWLEPVQAAVMGHPTTSICQSWINLFSFDQILNPRLQSESANPLQALTNVQSCNVPAEDAFDPVTNPTGVRCSLQDYMVNVLGTRESDGFARRPHDNVGVQYGLTTLLDGTISVAQFLDLNAKVGSRDINYDRVATRAVAEEEVLATAYRGGLFNQGDQMHLPIIDIRGNNNLEIHHNWHSYEMRARLDRSNGHHDNQVIWTLGPLPSGDSTYLPNAFVVMDEWLSAIEADSSNTPYAEKVIANKPAGAKDLCTDGIGGELPFELCSTLYPAYSEPRVIAGEPEHSDVGKCALKPLNRADYTPVTFNDAQWNELVSIFPDGVCDYNKPDIGREPTIPWMGYANGPGGQPLPRSPQPHGWSSPALRAQ